MNALYIALVEEALEKILQLSKSIDAASALKVIGYVIEKIKAVQKGQLDVRDARTFIDDAMKPLLDGLSANDAAIDDMLKNR